MKAIEIKNNTDLRTAIIEQINAIREGTASAPESNAISNLVGKLLQTVKVDLMVLKYLKENSDKPLATGELPSAKLTKD